MNIKKWEGGYLWAYSDIFHNYNICKPLVNLNILPLRGTETTTQHPHPCGEVHNQFE